LKVAVSETSSSTVTTHVVFVPQEGSLQLLKTDPGSGDTIIGNGGKNRLLGVDGDDHVEGLAGDDVLDRGVGVDFLDGGDGSDTCTNGETVLNCEA
jgi:hypothetical protein